jgi:hypothetical protein
MNLKSLAEIFLCEPVSAFSVICDRDQLKFGRQKHNADKKNVANSVLPRRMQTFAYTALNELTVGRSKHSRGSEVQKRARELSFAGMKLSFGGNGLRFCGSRL